MMNRLQIPYSTTNSHSKIVLDYIANSIKLDAFITTQASYHNIEDIITAKAKQPINKVALVNALSEQHLTSPQAVLANIAMLEQPNTFTICTAHQPNIFTGHLYFVYKIAHAIALAAKLTKLYPTYNFVPIYYMGSEDADIAELNHINIASETLTWHTTQQGAVGRMVVDEALVALIDNLEKQLAHAPHTAEIIKQLRNCYALGSTIQHATLQLVNYLFGSYGLVTLIADNALLKQQMIPVFTNEILHQTSHQHVLKTNSALAQHYIPQATSRPINLFYLKGNIRNRIELTYKDISQGENIYEVHNTDIKFTQQEILKEIAQYPEHFSPNVILRALYQETILPNIAFVGGGGELAYWLQLKGVFDYYKICYPMLVLRNSFLLATNAQLQSWQKLGLSTEQLFNPLVQLQNDYTLTNSTNTLNTFAQAAAITTIYTELTKQVAAIDVTLQKHTKALLQKQLNKLKALDKKLLRAEKRNLTEALQKIAKSRNLLFPQHNLQERYDNIVPYYATYGKQIINDIITNSEGLTQQFSLLTLP